MLNSSLVAKVWNRFGSVAFAIFIEILNSVHRKRCVCHYPKSSHSSAFSAFWRPPATLDTWPNKWDASGNEFEMIDLASQQERRLAGWLSCWRCSSGGIAKWNSVFRFSPFVIRRSSRTWTRPRLKFSAPASVRGRLVHDCRLSDVEWRRKGKKSLNGKWLQTSIPVQLVVSCDWPLGTQNWAMGSGCGLDGIRWRTWLYPLGTHSIPFLSSSLFAGTGGKQIKGGYLLRYKSEYLLT